MKLVLKRKLDTWIGLPILLLLNGIARALGFLLRRNHELLPAHKILVIKFQGMGSLVLAKPAIHQLRAAFPHSQIIFWGTPGTVTLAKEMPEFDQILTLNDKSLFTSLTSLASNLCYLWQQKLDWCFDLEVYSKLSSVLTTLTCARNRAGFAVEPVRFRRNIHTHLVMFNRYGYIGNAYIQLFSLLVPKAQDLEILERGGQQGFGSYKVKKLSYAKPDGPYIVVNPHCGPLASERLWPEKNFHQLAQEIRSFYPLHSIVLIGHGEEEEERSARFPSLDGLVDLTGRLNISSLLDLIKDADLVISNDTAALHMAVSFYRPTLGLFGPTRFASYFPIWREDCVALSKDFYCSPCVHHWDSPLCQGDNQCMKTISVEQALVASRILLSRAKKDRVIGRSARKYEVFEKGRYFQGMLFQSVSRKEDSEKAAG